VSHNTSCTVDHGSAGCPWESETRTNSSGVRWIITDGQTPSYVAAPKYRVEVNSDEDGCIEEVILHDATRMLVHLERTSRDEWWLGIYPEADPADEWESDACFDILRSKKRIEVEQR
jgi:hypothetical protein